MKRTVAIKRLIIVAAALALSGCGLPKMFTVASYALDGILLLSTGKSTNDHAISVAVGKDCALLRVIKGEDVCREFDTGENGRTVLAAENSDSCQSTPSICNGILGHKTRSAVLRFQRKNAIRKDGKVSAQLITMLRKQYESRESRNTQPPPGSPLTNLANRVVGPGVGLNR